MTPNPCPETISVTLCYLALFLAFLQVLRNTVQYTLDRVEVAFVPLGRYFEV